jgi:hypothetical protein
MSLLDSPVMQANKPMFEATDLLDFDGPFLPTPPTSYNAGEDQDGDEGMDLDAELAMMEAEEEEERSMKLATQSNTYKESPWMMIRDEEPVASCRLWQIPGAS